MSIFVSRDTRVVYQGGTGRQGSFHMLRNRAYGTKVVAATNPQKAGTEVEGVPVVASMTEAVDRFGATASCVFVPPIAVRDAVVEAAQSGVDVIVVITEGVPAHDEVYLAEYLADEHPTTRMIGPNCPGIISPGECNIGITPGDIAKAGGPVGVVSRSGTLTYQALHDLAAHDIGVTTCVGIGGDPIPGTGFVECLRAFEQDPDTQTIVLIGEIGGSDEERAAQFIADHVTKPVVAYIAGQTAPPGRRMGHAGAIISGTSGSARHKMDALRSAGASIASHPTAILHQV